LFAIPTIPALIIIRKGKRLYKLSWDMVSFLALERK
jgi:hypothetical protein